MKIKIFFLLNICLITSKCFAQRRDEYICASDTAKIKIESGLYVLQPLASATGGIKAPKSDIYYCIMKDNKMTLENVDSINVGFDKYSNEFYLNFHFNKIGTEQLANFSKNNMGKDIGLFINNRLLNAAHMVSSIETGQMKLEGNYSESEIVVLKKEIEAVTQEQRL